MKEYILKFVDPQVAIQEESKEDFKELMGWDEKEFMSHVFVRLSEEDTNTLSDYIKPEGMTDFGKDKVGHVGVNYIKKFIKKLEGRTFYASTTDHKPDNPDVGHGGGSVVWLDDILKLAGDALCTKDVAEDKE